MNTYQNVAIDLVGFWRLEMSSASFLPDLDLFEGLHAILLRDTSCSSPERDSSSDVRGIM
jgi:hypothetical protein